MSSTGGWMRKGSRRTRNSNPDGAVHFEPLCDTCFWICYRRLDSEVRELADKSFDLLKQNPHHPSLRLKKVGLFWSARVGLQYRVLAYHREDGLVWFWIGPHGEYDQVLSR